MEYEISKKKKKWQQLIGWPKVLLYSVLYCCVLF